MSLSGVSMLSGAAASLIALSPCFSLLFSVVILCGFILLLVFLIFFVFFLFFSVCFCCFCFALSLSQPNISFLPSFLCNYRTNGSRRFTVENYSLDEIVFGSIYRQEVPLEAALQIADCLSALIRVRLYYIFTKNMLLRYYLDDAGQRVYTMKVNHRHC